MKSELSKNQTKSETYLWSHEPFVSSPPIERIEHTLLEGKKEEIDEMAIFRLENNKFLFIRFYGTKRDLNKGFTDLEEFEALNEAKKVYNSLFLGENDGKKEDEVDSSDS